MVVWLGGLGAVGWLFGCSAAARGTGGAARNAGSPELTDGEEEGVSEYLTLSGP